MSPREKDQDCRQRQELMAGATQGRGSCQGSIVADTTSAKALALSCTSHWHTILD
jgi:hypothetical protein